MKRKISSFMLVLTVLVLLSFVFSACQIVLPTPDDDTTCNHVDGNRDGVCDKCGKTIGECVHVDADNDGKCDKCGKVTENFCKHVDSDNDGKCDKCGKKYDIYHTKHIDVDGNGVCDQCSKTFSCTHVDQNGDDICDNCNRNVVVQFSIYGINDLHGMYVDTDTQPGVDELTTYLLNARQNGNAVVLSSGDMWQGSAESNNTKGKLATEWLNYVNCSSMTLGNHEFDWSTDKIKSNVQLADFPFLAINVYEHSTNKRAAYCDASTVVELGGIRVGIIGAIGNCYSSISASMCTDVYFKTGDELTSLVKAESDRLREEKNVDYIVYSIHDGKTEKYAYYDESLSDGYVDVVFEGHTHQTYTYTDSRGVKHIQGGGYNKAISQATVSYNLVDGNKNTNTQIVYNNVYSQCESNNIVNELVEKYRDEIGSPDEVVGYNETNRSSDELRQRMAQAYLNKGQKVWGGDYDIVLAGGYISVRDPYELPVGNVTVRQVQTLFPFDNQMHLCSIKGSDLLSRYFNSKSYVYASSSIASSVESQLRSGKGLDDIYYIVTDSYNTDYAANKLTKIASLGDKYFPRDCLVEYIMEGNLGKTQASDDCSNHVDGDGDLKCDKCGDYTVKVYGVADALSLAKQLDVGEATDSINIVGKITSIVSTDYGNCYIADDYGNSIYVFGIWGKNKVKYSNLSYKPQVGDTVILNASIKNYNGLSEVYQGVLLWTTQTSQN